MQTTVVDKYTFEDKVKELKASLVGKESFDTQINTLKVCCAEKDALNAQAKALAAFKENAAEKEELYTLQAAVKKLKEKTTEGFAKVQG